LSPPTARSHAVHTGGGAAGRARAGKPPKVHFFNTFFMNALATDDSKYNYKKVRQWTTEKRLKGYSLLDCEKVVIPIHQESHWVLGVINIKGKSLHFCDSMGGSDQGAMVRPGRCCSSAALPWLCCSSAALPWLCRSSAALPWRCLPNMKD
jgi:hypothetical protein